MNTELFNLLSLIANGLLFFTGFFAIIIYWLQERKKKIEAASLIISQINEIQDSAKEIASYISNDQLNETAFYEMLPIINENLWEKYKHYFVKKMDARSYSAINEFYNYALGMQEQQSLMKNMQKNFFVLTQNVVSNIESQYISNYLLQEGYTANTSIPYFHKKKSDLTNLLNNNLLICYTPAQIRLSLQKMLSKYSLLEITGSNGYRMLQKIANTKF